MATQQAGGVIPPTSLGPLPSPSPSQASTSASTTSSSPLPHPRRNPLRPGSAKEDAARRYVEKRLLHVSRRFVKKFGDDKDGMKEGGDGKVGSGKEGRYGRDGRDDTTGYTSMREVCRDLSEVVDVLWLSGTPSLQIPYLLNIALATNTYITAFPPSPRPTFAFLQRMDHAFASLLSGHDIDTGEPLPGFNAFDLGSGQRTGMSGTEMVRCRSLVEGMRVAVVEVMSKGVEEEESEGSEDDTENEMEMDGEGRDDGEEEDEEWQMQVAKVYERTMEKLGELLGTGPGAEEVTVDANPVRDKVAEREMEMDDADDDEDDDVEFVDV